jgi:hypothetical protein
MRTKKSKQTRAQYPQTQAILPAFASVLIGKYVRFSTLAAAEKRRTAQK